ncbi:alcohol dehydrogenase [Irpex rosettiformis]|uniref:Alcohol dehydrogenase n=1 Tax=Irpex rosettiformis TaxID=378272 RepID=A0ACB8U1T2_9APHY|nr:alcohol dehydrogenase [Irpex rosettiformis]
MAPVKNGRLLFNEYPEGYPIPGKTTVYDESETIDLENVPLDGGFLLKVLNVSVDPYLRGKMRVDSAYSDHFLPGKPVYNLGVGVVLRSELSGVKPGDHIYGYLPFQQYVVKPSLDDYQILQNEHNLPWSAFVGVAGMPGETAYYSWKEYSSAKKGEVAFVSTAAGSVGSFIVQLAKADGLKVIASAGSDEKVAFAKSIGADVAFNYKTTDTNEVLAKEGPIDVYYDNVGGSSLDAALAHASQGARFIECGMISGYNADPPPVKNLMSIIYKEIKIFGFLITSLRPKYVDEFYREVPKLVANGTIKYLEDRTQGLQYAGHALEAVQRGTNKAKSVIIVNEE